MTIELLLIILLAVFVFILMGVALHLAKTIKKQNDYISELERDYRIANAMLTDKTVTSD